MRNLVYKLIYLFKCIYIYVYYKRVAYVTGTQVMSRIIFEMAPLMLRKGCIDRRGAFHTKVCVSPSFQQRCSTGFIGVKYNKAWCYHSFLWQGWKNPLGIYISLPIFSMIYCVFPLQFNWNICQGFQANIDRDNGLVPSDYKPLCRWRWNNLACVKIHFEYCRTEKWLL